MLAPSLRNKFGSSAYDDTHNEYKKAGIDSGGRSSTLVR